MRANASPTPSTTRGFIDEILKGYAQRDPTPLPNTIWGFPKDVAGYDYDLKKAKEYYQKAVAEGAPMKRPIEIHMQQQLEQTMQARAGVPERPGDDRHQSEDRRRHLVEPDDQRRPSRKPRPDMWIHWVSTYFVDPENWVGQMYDSQFHGTWKASCLVQEPEGRRAAAQGARPGRAGGARAALRGGDAADRGRLPRHLDLQHDRACRHRQPGQGRPLLPGRQRLRGALDEPRRHRAAGSLALSSSGACCTASRRCSGCWSSPSC